MTVAGLRNNSGFTMIELMVVVAIIGVLASIAIPNYMRYREKAYKVDCKSNRRYIEIKAQTYFAEYGTANLEDINAYSCPRGGVYVWMSTNPDDPEFGRVICSLHSIEPADELPIEPVDELQFEIPAGENISENNNFEALEKYPKKGRRKYIKDTQVDGWSADGNKIEIWADGMKGVNAPEGKYFIELDSKKNVADRIYQEIPTEKGRIYEIQLKARARDVGTSDVIVSWGNQEQEVITPEKGKWNDYTIRVVGTGQPMTLALSEPEEQNDGRGPLLDAIQVIPIDEVESP